MLDARFARLLRSIAKATEGATDNEIDSLIIMLERGSWKAKKASLPASRRRADPKILRDMLAQLGQASDRDAGQAVLEKGELARPDLEALSKLANVYVTKADTLAAIKEKLVENMIGSRLNSEAIRGGYRSIKR